MAVDPGGVPASGGAAVIEQAGLGQDHEGPLGMLPLPGLELGGGDFLQRPAKVNGSGAGALPRPPGDRACQGVVQLEGTRPVAKALHMISGCANSPPARRLPAGGKAFSFEKGDGQLNGNPSPESPIRLEIPCNSPIMAQPGLDDHWLEQACRSPFLPPVRVEMSSRYWH